MAEYNIYIYDYIIYIILYSEAMAERGEAIADPCRGDGEAVAERGEAVPKQWQDVAK